MEKTLAHMISPDLLDRQDPLRHFREQFYFPQFNGKSCLYFCGNSLGLQPKSADKLLRQELQKWADSGVEGHFKGERPWVYFHKLGKKALANLLGAKENEVVMMNNLTTNLHLMLGSFYEPKGKRRKVIIEKGAFPSDYFAVSTHMKMKGIDPLENLIQIEIPKNGYLSNEVIADSIKKAGDELALVLMPGVQYYTGQFFDLKKITNAAHEAGAFCGFDLAHAIGNLPMQLHDWGADFAAWCSYKYLNSGPGNVSGIFVHERHAHNTDLNRMAGWWGQDEAIRFKMEHQFYPIAGADGWMLSNVNILGTAVHLASLEMFEEAGIENLRSKSIKLTRYLEELLEGDSVITENLEILTPKNPLERGAQLSLSFHKNGKRIFEFLNKNGVIADWREPNVIRVAPAPLYNSFQDVHDLVQLISIATRANND